MLFIRKIAVIPALTTALLLLTSCSRPPELSEIYDEVVSLIEASYEINEIFFGRGLPTDEGQSDLPGYSLVRVDAKFKSIDEIKAATALVYSEDYREGLYEVAFGGVASFTPGAHSVVKARFIEHNGRLRQDSNTKALISAKRIYDYSSMKIVKPSNARNVNISIDSHLEGSGEILNITLSFVFEDGRWLLNSPTY
ncbi:MAG TPA: hypothetical protein GX011_00290 [Clostridiales bacterium]|jgi:hypothetical protein|nr:hypothetical protein [Clostridiales bacterium]